MRVERAVVDSNVIISAALTRGPPFQALHWIVNNAILVYSPPTFAELADRLMRPKFDRYVSRQSRLVLIADLEAIAEWTEITGMVRLCADPENDMIVETAINGLADAIVTGDRDLLALDPVDRVRIFPPKVFLRQVGQVR